MLAQPPPRWPPVAGGAGAGSGCATAPSPPGAPPAPRHLAAVSPAKNNPGKPSRERRDPARDVTGGREERESQSRKHLLGEITVCQRREMGTPRAGNPGWDEPGHWYRPVTGSLKNKQRFLIFFKFFLEFFFPYFITQKQGGFFV